MEYRYLSVFLTSNKNPFVASLNQKMLIRKLLAKSTTGISKVTPGV
jgi:hypothetical protein